MAAWVIAIIVYLIIASQLQKGDALLLLIAIVLGALVYNTDNAQRTNTKSFIERIRGQK